MITTRRSTVSRGTLEEREPRENRESDPHVGLFYFIWGHLYWEGKPVAHGTSTPYFISYPQTLAHYWRHTLVRRLPQLGKYDQRHFPRGQVVFDRKKETYQLMADKCIVRDFEIIKEILLHMNLPQQNVTISSNQDFECQACQAKRLRHARESDTDNEIRRHFDYTEDGRRLFLPWGNRGSAYVIPPGTAIRRIRKQLKRRIIIARLVMSAVAPLALFGVGFTRRIWAGLGVIILPFIICRIGIHALFRRFEKIDKTDPVLRGMGGHSIVTTVASKRYEVAGGLIVLAAIVVLHQILSPTSNRDRKHSMSPNSPAISIEYTGSQLPRELCLTISGFIDRVDSAARLRASEKAREVIHDELAKIQEKLKEFGSTSNIRALKEIAREYAQRKIRVKALSDKRGWLYEEPQFERERIKACLRSFKRMCPRILRHSRP